MKAPWINKITILAVTAFALAISSCATFEKGFVEKIAPPQIIAENGKPKLEPGGIIHKKLKELSPELQDIMVNDRYYVYITREWFLELKGWTDRYIARVAPNLGDSGPQLKGYTRTYSMLMNSAANFAIAGKYKVKGAALIGLMVVRNDNDWGKLKGDGQKHDYIVGMTEDGGLVLDLQTGQIIELRNFPNNKSILAMLF